MPLGVSIMASHGSAKEAKRKSQTEEAGCAHLMEIVFLVKLALDLSIDGQAKQEGVLFAGGGSGVKLRLA